MQFGSASALNPIPVDSSPVERPEMIAKDFPAWLQVMRRVSCAMTLLVSAAACERHTWKGWIYPDKNDLTRSIELGPFESLAACRASVHRTTATMIDPNSWDYECGHHCRLDPSLGINVCRRTER